MKYISFVMAAFMFAAASCGNHAENSGKAITYPFTYIDTKKEEAGNGSYDEMLLYSCGNNPSPDTLKMFCAEKKKEFTTGDFHVIAFFDGRENAVFSKFPITAFYGGDEVPMKHIKAQYTFNRSNGYSKLTCYQNNAYESAPNTFDIP